MLSAMAQDLVERSGLGETAGAVWKTLGAGHQKLRPRILPSAGRELFFLHPPFGEAVDQAFAEVFCAFAR
jgi:hypothetical protein